MIAHECMGGRVFRVYAQTRGGGGTIALKFWDLTDVHIPIKFCMAIILSDDAV